MALQGVPKGLLGHIGHVVRLAQAATTHLPTRDRHFCNEVKGHSMLAFCRDIDVQYKTAFVLARRLREAMASSIKTLQIGGEGCTAEIDGAYFGGHVQATKSCRGSDRPTAC